MSEKNYSSYPFISSYTFRGVCQHGKMLNEDTNYVKNLGNEINPQKVKEGDLIYLVSELIPYFFEKIDPYIKNPYKLLTGRSDITINNNYEKYLNDKIISWWSVNSSSEKIHSLPLGLQNLHWLYYNNPQSNIELLKEVQNEKKDKKGKLLMSFRIGTNEKERKKCYNHFRDYQNITIRNFSQKDRKNVNFVKEFWREIKRHKFIICPWGRGVDCHRNWEIWYLGSSYPIIKKHPALKDFYDLPALWIDNWSDVDKLDLDKEYEKIKNQKWNWEKLKFDYWKNKILNI